ncbi:MAG: hypothetical protein HC888_07405 [Candidatus Competibacteraceae bacterium]|nr:hypothetical protein [Candidatus Competibacteraceae bacterium]
MTEHEIVNLEYKINKNLQFLGMLSNEFLAAHYANAKRTHPMLTRPYPGMFESLSEQFDARLAYAGTSLQFI